MGDAITIIFDMIAEEDGIDWLSIGFNGIIVLIMIFTGLNAWHMRKLATQSNTISDRMAEIQATNVKVLILPKIREILTGLYELTRVAWNSMDEQMDNNNKAWQKLSEMRFYFNEEDEIYKSIKSLNDEMWALSGLIGERESFEAMGGKVKDPEERSKLSRKMTTKAKQIRHEIVDISEKIVHRFRIEMPRPHATEK